MYSEVIYRFIMQGDCMSRSNAEYVRQIINSLQKLDFIQPDEIPNINLYMDQVTTFMDEHLSQEKRYEDDKILTKIMINNYTKNHLLPPPLKKKYSKEHMLLLIFIYYFKNILSINDIRSIFTPLSELFSPNGAYKDGQISLESIYEEVFTYEKEQVDVLAKDVIRKFKKAENAFDGKVEKEEDKEFLVCFTFICILSFDVYIKKKMIEKMIDQHIMPRFGGGQKTDKKKDKNEG